MFNDDIKDYKEVFDKMVDFTKDYIIENNLRSAVIGISGGIDSTVVAALLHEASMLVPRDQQFKVYGYSLPTNTTNEKEYLVSTWVGDAFADEFKVVNINDTAESISKFFNTDDSDVQSIKKYRDGNIKARLRMMFLYDAAKSHRGFVVGTDNYTEMLLGFSTIGGDALADYMPIQYFWKTQVYRLADYLLKKYKEEDNLPAMNAMYQSINLKPQDGLGISTSDMDQIGAKNYFEVDDILQTYERYDEYRNMGGHDTPEMKTQIFNDVTSLYGNISVRNVVMRREKNFKLKLPLEFIPDVERYTLI